MSLTTWLMTTGEQDGRDKSQHFFLAKHCSPGKLELPRASFAESSYQVTRWTPGHTAAEFLCCKTDLGTQ